tara:strand:- start:274 stop:414 length:141 start_codon:yes stop_codon:yes gene_type:complete
MIPQTVATARTGLDIFAAMAARRERRGRKDAAGLASIKNAAPKGAA